MRHRLFCDKVNLHSALVTRAWDACDSTTILMNLVLTPPDQRDKPSNSQENRSLIYYFQSHNWNRFTLQPSDVHLSLSSDQYKQLDWVIFMV